MMFVKDFSIWLGVFLVWKSFVPACKMWSGLPSCKVGITWSTLQLTFVPENDQTLIISWENSHSVSWSYCLLKYIWFSIYPLDYSWDWIYFSSLFLSFNFLVILINVLVFFTVFVFSVFFLNVFALFSAFVLCIFPFFSNGVFIYLIWIFILSVTIAC